MMMEMLLLFIVVVIIMLILSIYTVDENPTLSVPLIMIGIIFCAFSAYGLIEVEWVVVGMNTTTGFTEASTYSTTEYMDYAYVFVMLAFIFAMFFIRAGFNLWKESLETKGQMEYKRR